MCTTSGAALSILPTLYILFRLQQAEQSVVKLQITEDVKSDCNIDKKQNAPEW